MKPNPRRWLRFSLRTLVVAVTISCIATAYWYRVPYPAGTAYSPNQRAHWWVERGPTQNTDVNVRVGRDIRRYRRVLRGEPIREGQSEYFSEDEKLVGRDNWKDGKLHGHWIRWYTTGVVREHGEYVAGRKEGEWENLNSEGLLERRAEYLHGLPAGTWHWYEKGKNALTMKFEGGELLEVNGRSANDYIGRAFRRGQIDNKNVAGMLHRDAGWDFKETPLTDSMVWLGECFACQFIFSKGTESQRAESETSQGRSVPLNAALAVILEPHGLAADYDAGRVLISTSKQAEARHDKETLGRENASK
jgi:hypothetical protein